MSMPTTRREGFIRPSEADTRKAELEADGITVKTFFLPFPGIWQLEYVLPEEVAE